MVKTAAEALLPPPFSFQLSPLDFIPSQIFVGLY